MNLVSHRKKVWCLSACLFFLILKIMLCIVNALSLDGTTAPIFKDNQVVFSDGDVIKGCVQLHKGFIVSSGNIFLESVFPINGAINLNNNGMTLHSDLTLASGATFPESGWINGNGHSIFLQGDLIIPVDVTIAFKGNTTIDGGGHALIIAQELINGVRKNGKIIINGPSGTTLTLKNVLLKGVKSNDIVLMRRYNNFASNTLIMNPNHAIIFDNVIISLEGDFIFRDGAIAIKNDVMVTGPYTFFFMSAQNCIIDRCSTFYLDRGTTFYYESIHPQKRSDQLVMVDVTSAFFLNSGTIKTARSQGLTFIKGHLFVDGKSCIDGGGTVKELNAISFGDGIKENNFSMTILPAASLKIINGTFLYNNIDTIIDGVGKKRKKNTAASRFSKKKNQVVPRKSSRLKGVT